jgi:hypothetical protein
MRKSKSELTNTVVNKRIQALVEAKLLAIGNPEHRAARDLPENVVTVFPTSRFYRWAGIDGPIPRYGVSWRVGLEPERAEKGDAVLPNGGMTVPVYVTGLARQAPEYAETAVEVARAIRRYLTIGGELPTEAGGIRNRASKGTKLGTKV